MTRSEILQSPKIMLVAGEASGDQLGGRLMAAIRARLPEARFIGVGGPRMTGEGLNSFFRWTRCRSWALPRSCRISRIC